MSTTGKNVDKPCAALSIVRNASLPGSPGGAMLNEYQLKFVHHFMRCGVTFLIIGGQARWLLDRQHETRDLDLWVRLGPEDKPKLEHALIAWGTEHPLHTSQNWVAPLRLRPGVQIAFPEYDDVWFLT